MRQIPIDNSISSIWIEGESEFDDSKTLLTVSNKSGIKTYLITPTAVIESEAKYFVQTPPERIVTANQRRLKAAKSAMKRRPGASYWAAPSAASAWPQRQAFRSPPSRAEY